MSIAYGIPRVYESMEDVLERKRYDNLKDFCEDACGEIGIKVRFVRCRYNTVLPSITGANRYYTIGINKENYEVMLQQFAFGVAVIEADRWCPGYLRDHILNDELWIDTDLWEEAICIRRVINKFVDKVA